MPLPQDGRPVSPANPLEKAQINGLNRIGALTFLGHLKRNAEFHASTPDEA